MKTPLNLLGKMCEETVRMERVIFIAGAIASGDALSDDLNEFFDDTDLSDIEKLFGKIPDYLDIDGHGYERSDSIYEWLRSIGKIGFLVQFATPVMTPSGPSSRSYSWGYYSTKWIYADSVEEAVELGMKWVKQCRRNEDRKAKAKKKGGE